MEYLVAKWLHIMSSTFLFGTGIGSAFYLLFATISKDTRAIAFVTRYVVIADTLFTATTAIVQPATGFWMIHIVGFPLSQTWLMWSIILYVAAIACWLPVVWLQIRLRDLARQALQHNTALPPLYWRYFKMWVALGIPAFFAFVAIFYLMVMKPV